MALLDSLQSFLNRSPADVMMEQMRKLYLRLYPYIVEDFAHIEDVRLSTEAIAAQLQALSAAIASHIHTVPEAPGAALPSGTSVPPNPAVIFIPAVGWALVLAVGTPQPTGEGVALFPSRVATPIEGVALPPLAPSDFLA